jgi:uncharacterized RDD family membrane protein YckC
MKCPKCGYLGFAEADRCRNCGYEFSLAPLAEPPDLPLSQPETSRALDDLALIDAGSTNADRRLDRTSDKPAARDDRQDAAACAPGRAESDLELPLFGPPFDDAPLITRPAPPRPPLAVRRSSPEMPRVHEDQPRPASLDLSMELETADPRPRLVPADRALTPVWFEPEEAPAQPALLVARLGAFVLDALVLLAVDTAVVYLTLQISGVALGEFTLVPKGPLVGFLVVQNVGYLVAFTLTGQTLGKMAAGIKVVSANPDDVMDLGRALKRTVAWLVLAMPVGLGFLTVLLSRERRGLHDLFAGTRVVRASA